MLQCLMSLSTHYIPPFKSWIHIWIMPDWPAHPDQPLHSIWCHSNLSIMHHNCTAVGVCHERDVFCPCLKRNFTIEVSALLCALYNSCCIGLKWLMMGQHKVLPNIISAGVLSPHNAELQCTINNQCINA